MLLLQLANSLSGNALNAWGVLPRHLGSLPGILLAPWLHAGWWHLLNNLPGLMLLGWLGLLDPLRSFLATSGFIIVGSGTLAWQLDQSSLHLLASGWVFGL